VELEHLKIKTRSIDEKFEHVHEQFMNMTKKEKIDHETVSKVRKEFTGMA
jgi:hypothetical protein